MKAAEGKLAQRHRGTEELLVIFLCLVLLAGCLNKVGQGGAIPSPAPAAAASPKKEDAAKPAESWPLARGNALAQGVATGQLPQELDVVWKMTVEKGAFEATPVIAGGVVYIGDMDGAVFALNLADGKEVWKKKFESGFIASPAVRPSPQPSPEGRGSNTPSPSGRGSLLYLGDIDGKFYALDLKTGEPKWTFGAKAEIDAGANFWGDHVLFGSQDANLYCLQADTGELVWKFAIEDQIRCMPTVVGDRSFVAGCDSILHIVDLTQGKEAAGVPIDAPTGVTPAVLGDNVYFGTEGGVLFAVNWKEAKVTWRVEAASAQPYRSAPAVQEGIVVVGSRSRSVLALDPATGNELWNFATKQRVDSSPVIVGSRVFVGAADGRLYALDLTTGQQLWEYQASGGFSGSPAVADGKLVIATDRGVVYCFGMRQK